MITQLTQLYGIGATLAGRIRRQLGRGVEGFALERIKANPYCLLEVDGVGFKRADRIATGVYDVSLNNPARAFWGNQYTLEQDGSLPEADFFKKQTQAGLDSLEHRFEGVARELGRVWLPGVLQAEREFAVWCSEVPTFRKTPTADVTYTPERAKLLEGLDRIQAEAALQLAFGADPLSALTGGAGTGKTRIIAGACQLAAAEGLDVAVLAFAGKAADRVRESLDRAGASADLTGTIHRALGWNGGNFTRNLKQKIVIVDEASMVPIYLLWAVIQAMQPGSRLILVGDEGQLEPIGHGQPFKDLLKLSLVRSVVNKNYRQQDVQGIIKFATAIRERKDLPVLDSSVQLHASNDMSDFANTAIESMSLLGLEEWQVITWKGEDAEEANSDLQDMLNPLGLPLFVARDRSEIRAGDKVMVKQNSYTYSVFNGQLGVVQDSNFVMLENKRKAETLDDWADADESGMVTEKIRVLCVQVRIAGELVNIPLDEAPDLLKLGYAITVHKSQGSDWEAVMVYQPRAVAFASNNWWYTAVTRARAQLYVAFTCQSRIKQKGQINAYLGAFWQNAHTLEHETPSTLIGRIRKIWNEREQMRFSHLSEFQQNQEFAEALR